MELRFTPRVLKEVEDRSKKAIMDMVATVSMTNILLIVEKGLGTNEAGAEKAVEEYLSDQNNDLTSLYLLIIEKFQEQGFLPRKVDLSEMREMVEDPQKAIDQANTSANNG